MRSLPALSILFVSLAMGLTACSGEQGRSAAVAARAQAGVFEGPVPKAACGAQDPVETGLQGQVPLVDRVSGRNLQGYACNLELVGQFSGGLGAAAGPAVGDGAGWQHAWFDDCSYYGVGANGTLPSGAAPRPGQTNPGVVVINAADSARPQASAYLDSLGMLDPWESLKVNETRELLVGTNAVGGSLFGGGGPEIDVYDLSGDCSQPRLLASKAVGTEGGHGGHFAPDGMTYYATGLRAVDLADPTAPALISNLGVGSHDLSLSVDGNRAYLTGSQQCSGASGMQIFDVSEIQARRDDPLIEFVGDVCWDDGGVAQHTQPMTINGVPYVLFVDEGGLVSSASSASAAGGGLVGVAGAARIIDISDETQPRVISKLKLEVHMPENANAIFESLDGSVFGYQGHYCTASDGRTDNTTYTVHDAQIVICGYMQSGIRVFDVRDPYAPREIAYYNPPAQPGYHPGSNYNLSGVCGSADWASANSRYRPDRNEIWFTSQCNGFQIVRFSRPLAELLDAGN